MPQMCELTGRKVLFVDGHPFLILGVQWDCDTPLSPELSDPLYAQAANMGCNTAVIPLYWREVEPVENKFDLRGLDHRIQMARRNGLRLALVWFGTYQNGFDPIAGHPGRARGARHSQMK
jgi:beta-galactosidase GanA